MHFFRIAFIFGVLATSFGAWGQAPAAPDYEAEALRYLLETLLPKDHPTYYRLSYSGFISPVPFTFGGLRPCFTTPDSLLAGEVAGTLLLREHPTQKAVPFPSSTGFKAVRRRGRNLPFVSVDDALAWRGRRVVPIYLSLRHQYVSYYFISLDSAGHVVASCRWSAIQ